MGKLIRLISFLINPMRFYKKNSFLLTKWARIVYERDKNTCAKCGKVGVRKDDRWVGLRFNAHHIYPKSIYPQKAFSVRNGITLCEPCHKAWHRKHGLAVKPFKKWLQS